MPQITNSELSSSERFSHLKQWLSTLPSVSMKLDSIRPASSDASFRRYFRIDGDGVSYIAMDAPPHQ